MRGIFRRLRGIIGTGITWAFGWAGMTFIWGWIAGATLGNLGLFSVVGFFQGFLAGGAFAVILSIAERRHTLDELSLKRVALWGGIGGMLLTLPIAPYLALRELPILVISYFLALYGLFGAGLASGSVALARIGDTNLLREADTPLLPDRD